MKYCKVSGKFISKNSQHKTTTQNLNLKLDIGSYEKH